MRIIIDLQGAQGASRYRGIGRYCLSLAQGIARNRDEHEVFIALNGLFPDTIEPIRAALDSLLPPENILVWQVPEAVRQLDQNNEARRRAAELVRESVIASVSPDYVLVTSVFEGMDDDVVTSIGELSSAVPTAAVLFDLIPLIHRHIYLVNPVAATWYENKLAHIRNADLLLAISDSARLEAVQYLGRDDDNAVNISTAADEHFTPGEVDAGVWAKLAQHHGLVRPFVMYTGGLDHRKNIGRLIEAYSTLPAAVRRKHQLAIVCAMDDGNRRRLLQLAEDEGLSEGELILTGYISEQDLLAFYRMCKLFIFPSWHEGFGLPALEAMCCGQAVIAGDRSSLPEVVGLESALFNPFDIAAMSDKIKEVLTDDRFRVELKRHGLEQAKKFSWDETAHRTWHALEASHARHKQARSPQLPQLKQARRPRLAFFSPLLPAASGISGYSAELLPELARHYRIEVITDQEQVSDPWVLGNAPIRNVAWFHDHAHEFDRILYHFGNSIFHGQMFELLRDHPGVVVLHDFFLSGIIAHQDIAGEKPNSWARALVNAHGWLAVVDRFTAAKEADVAVTYPANLQVLQDALGVIVHSDYSRQLARHWYGAETSANWRLIPLLRQPTIIADGSTRRELGVTEGEFLVCSFGIVAETKLNHRLLAAWQASPLATDPRCRLVFVGQSAGSDYGEALERAIQADDTGRIEITGRSDDATFRRWLTAADMSVQLRTLSRGETSATALDCMNAGMATIVNANGSMAELPRDAVWMLEDDFDDADLVEALTTLWSDEKRRRMLGANAKAHIAQHHQPHDCADAYADAIEHYYNEAMTGEYGLGRALIESDDGLTPADWVALATSVANNHPPKPRLRRLLFDVSALVQVDSKSGVQRVVRSILSQWLAEPPSGWIVEPVYAEFDKPGYRHARRFTSRFLGIFDGWGDDDTVEPHNGDVFIGIDLVPALVPQQRDVLQAWRRRGVRVQFGIHDLLPVTQPENFPDDVPAGHHLWLQTIAQFDGVICVSRATAEEFCTWLDHYGPLRDLPLAIDWFHLGADIDSSVPTRGLPKTAQETLEQLSAAPSFLSVGTLEPRKAQRQTLAAFDVLWTGGTAANLVFVGKLGWKMEGFAQQLRNHPQFGRRLFWLEAISDEYLERIYTSCCCLIAASEGEGFGLPLIEAGRHGLPVLARDIPVFREVAGEAANYFTDSNDPAVIRDAVAAWLEQADKPVSNTMPWLTWKESAAALLASTLGHKPPRMSWMSGQVLRFYGNDARMGSDVGIPRRQHMRSSGEAGFLVFGPHRPLAAGSYRLTAMGGASQLTGTEFVQLASNSGNRHHLHVALLRNENGWRIEGDVEIEQPITDFEIRVWVDDGSELTLESIVIEPLN